MMRLTALALRVALGITTLQGLLHNLVVVTLFFFLLLLLRVGRAACMCRCRECAASANELPLYGLANHV